MERLRLLELYSGIGGMRYAMEETRLPYELAAAVDINTVVNDIYNHNFGGTNHCQRNIQSFTGKEIDDLLSDIVLLSPPCQPFTRLGLKLDFEDERSKSFKHLLDIFPTLNKKPSFVLLENVVGFEISEARNHLIKTLSDCGYIYQEFHLTPSQFGIPNSRMRYYLLAKLRPLKFAFGNSCEVLREWPVLRCNINIRFECSTCQKLDSSACVIGHYLEQQPDSYFDQYYLTKRELKKHSYVLDIVEENAQNSCCFTKSYTHYLQGTGSVLHPTNAPEVCEIYEAVSQNSDETQRVEILKTLKLRYFTPKEVANLMSFPKHFTFPDHITTKQRYKALGNSINVFVVSKLLQLLLL